MRILFSFIGGHGHFVPLIPVAQAAAAAGHTVAFGCGPSMAAAVAATGFPVFHLGSGAARPPERMPLRPLDAAREDEEFRDRFVRRDAQHKAPLMIDLCRAWQPDIVVCDETDFGSMVAAERLGLPHASVLVMAAGSFVRASVIGEALAELRALHGLPADPELDMLRRHLVLSPFPPSFRDPGFPLPATARSFRPRFSAQAAAAPAWPAMRPAAPLVYFTLGTVFNMESGDLFARALSGLAGLPANIFVTIGEHLDPAELGAQPANVHIARYVGQDAILPHCSLVVSHGGSGSVSGALAHGLPMVVLPMGADQPLNAARCVSLGLGRMLEPVSATPLAVREAAAMVLSAPACRQAAARMQGEYAGLPGPDYALSGLEAIA